MFSLSKRPLRVLDFDSEVRPMHYSEWRPEGQITAIAWSWVGEKSVHVELLEQDGDNEIWMLKRFRAAYDAADMVTGHYIRKHDLPLLNDHYVRLGMKPLGPKLTQDTQADLVKVKSLGKSQENLAVTFGLSAEKHHMTGADWRKANTLSPEGAALAKKRVVDDVIQHKELRAALLERGLLKTPKEWRP